LARIQPRYAHLRRNAQKQAVAPTFRSRNAPGSSRVSSLAKVFLRLRGLKTAIDGPVAKICHGPEVRRYARELRRKSYRLGDAAMEVIYDGLHWHRRTDLAWKILTATGVVPFSAEQLRATPVNASTDLEKAS
jgi:hypothetical protein